MSQKNRNRLVIICGEAEFDVLNDILCEYLPQVLEGMETHFEIEAVGGLSVFAPHEWPEGKLHVMQFLSLD